MNWSYTMQEHANRVSGKRVGASTKVQPTPEVAWCPHDVWLTRIKQPRDRAALRRTEERIAP